MSRWPRWVLAILMVTAGLCVLLLVALTLPLQLEANTPVALLPPIYWVYTVGAALASIVCIMSFLYVIQPTIPSSYLISSVIGAWSLAQGVFRVFGVGWDKETVDALTAGGSFVFASVVAFLTVRKGSTGTRGLDGDKPPKGA